MDTAEFTAFIKLVQDMREAQVSYFKETMSFKKKPYLIKAKQLEKQVDEFLKDYSDASIQKRLF